jgi:hypothetical protein
MKALTYVINLVEREKYTVLVCKMCLSSSIFNVASLGFYTLHIQFCWTAIYPLVVAMSLSDICVCVCVWRTWQVDISFKYRTVHKAS